MNAQLLRCHPPVLLACNEHDRHVVQRPRPTLEEAFGFTRCHSADVDAVDLHAGGNPSRRAGEGEPEAGSDDGQDEESERASLDAHARRGLPPAPGARGNGP